MRLRADFSCQEAASLEALQAAVAEDATWRALPEEFRGPLLRRYLRDKKGDLGASVAGLQGHLRWRGEGPLLSSLCSAPIARRQRRSILLWNKSNSTTVLATRP